MVYPRDQYWGQYFLTFVNDLDNSTKCNLSKLAHGTKLGGLGDGSDGCADVQRDMAGELGRQEPHEVQ